MWLMLQQDTAGRLRHRHRRAVQRAQFVDAAASELGIKITWSGKGVDEKGTDANGKVIVAVDPRYFRPAEVETLLGDPTKAQTKLGWTPKVTFKELVAEMVREDLKSAERDELVKRHGYAGLRLQRVSGSQMSMSPDARIYVAGHRGMVGSALVRRLQPRATSQHSSPARRAELDLDQAAVHAFFARERPSTCSSRRPRSAASANNTYPAQFIHQNLMPSRAT
jgi:nucleoside-diphosphate-sugar epimerase